MPSFNDLKRNLTDSGSTVGDVNEVLNTDSSIVRVSRKDATLIEVEDSSFEGTLAAAKKHFNTDKDHLRMKIRQKGF